MNWRPVTNSVCCGLFCSYPLELHVVCKNTEYEELSEALNHENGLAVLGIMFEVRTLI